MQSYTPNKRHVRGGQKCRTLRTPKSIADVRTYAAKGLLYRLSFTQRASARRVVQDRLQNLLNVYRYSRQTDAYLREKAELENLIYQSPLAHLS